MDWIDGELTMYTLRPLIIWVIYRRVLNMSMIALLALNLSIGHCQHPAHNRSGSRANVKTIHSTSTTEQSQYLDSSDVTLLESRLKRTGISFANHCSLLQYYSDEQMLK